MSLNSFKSRSTLKVGTKEYEIYRLDALDKQGVSTKHLPYSLRILLENLLRTEDGRNVKAGDIRALAAWNKNSKPEKEIAFTPSRVLLQDFTGVPAVVDLAALPVIVEEVHLADPGLHDDVGMLLQVPHQRGGRRLLRADDDEVGQAAVGGGERPVARPELRLGAPHRLWESRHPPT